MATLRQKSALSNMAQNVLKDLERPQVDLGVLLKQIRGTRDLIEADMTTPPKPTPPHGMLVKEGDTRACAKLRQALTIGDAKATVQVGKL